MFSLATPQAFNVVFEKAIQDTTPADEVKQRVINLTDEITYSVYMYTARGLFERDKLIFLAQVTFQVSCCLCTQTAASAPAAGNAQACAGTANSQDPYPGPMHAHQLTQLHSLGGPCISDHPASISLVLVLQLCHRHTWTQTQGFLHARQTLYGLSRIPSLETSF